ncbi:MAG: YhdP family protein [Gammaproteobacteria bacterium]|nr:YhdP family protein [Gammaproteobacteria bacterium]
MKLNFSSIISLVSHAVLYTCTVILVVFAIFITIIRGYPNLSDIVESKIELRLGEILNADVSIESLDISRQKLFSQIVAQNVVITDRNNDEYNWALKKARLSINVYKSLLSRSLRIKEVSLEGLDLSLRRDESGDFHVNQVFLLSKSKMNQSAGSGNYSDVHLRLLDSDIHWLDELTETDYLFNDIDIAVDPKSKGYDVFLSGNLPETLGKSIRANVSIEGDIKNIADAKIDFYIKTDQFRMAEIAKRFVGNSGGKVPVIIDSELWGQVANKTLTGLRGSISADDIVVNSASKSELCLSDEYIQQLSVQFDWNNEDRNWQFLADDINIVTSKGNWPVTQVQFELQRHSLNAKTILAHIGNMNLGAICNTLYSYSPHIVRFEDQLQQYRLNASVEDLFMRFDLKDNHQSTFQYSGQFNDIDIWFAQGNRSVSGVSAYVVGGDAGGVADLNSNNIQLGLPTTYPGYDLKFAADGQLEWTHHGNVHEVRADRLKIYNDDLSMSARINTKIIDKDVYTDAQFYVDSAKANAVGDYFPLLQKTRRTKKWFTEAIHEGDVRNATIIMRGNMRAFPFHKQTGVFQVDVEVENGILEYKKGWPKLHDVRANVSIDKDHINIRSRQAKTLDSKIKKVDIEIDSFLRATLDLKGTIDGPGQDLLTFLGESNLVSESNSVLEHISLAGDSRLEIDFSRSLSKKLILPIKVSGNIHFLGNTLDLKSVGIELNDLAGEVQFTQAGATGEGISATLFRQPVLLSIDPAGEGASNLIFSGPFDLGAYLEQRYKRFSTFFSGIAPVNGEVYLPSFFKKNNPDKLKLIINSQLNGVKSTLPSPLNKLAHGSLPAILKFDQKQGLMSWQLDDLLSLYFSIQPKEPFELNLVELGEPRKSDIDNEGLMIAGSWKTLDPVSWLEVYKQYMKSVASSDKAVMPSIDVKFDSLQFPKWPAENISIAGSRDNSSYVLNLDSSLGKGSVLLPEDKSLPVSIDMKTLTINKGQTEDKKSSVDIDPRNTRPFSFSSQQLNFNDLKFIDVIVNTSSVENGLVFDKIKLAAQDMTLSGNGSWLLADQNATTSFDLQLESIDVEDSLIDLGFKSSLRKGELSATMNLDWDAAPHQFELDKLSGVADFKMKDGSVTEVNPGNAGRLLALLNLGAISRRLSLDFKDVTNKGFTFDSIKGVLNLSKGGNLQTDKISIKASSADIKINGETNLIEQTYNQNITVTPAVTGTLTAAGAIVGGPVGAAAGMIVDRVGSAVGLNKVSNIEYKMTGTWQSPVIEKVNKRKNNAPETVGPKSGP